ncbi:3917_t:CDS:2 [Scutellospora calospora]|uniref:3917_t:CDS:1 n=1 Tax=Scutellospora calospora TaxID=85575 RepID=A0ACA9L8G5_9GLOM|nr:3917_t:CDS:2 [Scutellospora calospora]
MVNIGIIGVGLVGSELISQLATYASSVPRISVIALTNSSKQLLSTPNYSPLELSTWKQTLQTQGNTANLSVFIDYVSNSPTPAIIIDNTSSQEIASQYPLFLEKGLHVVTPNKKAFSSEATLYKEIIEEAKKNKKLVFNESTVGAGLPIISTLKDLVRTGDKINRIEGIFSGTLSYIFNEFSKSGDDNGQKFSEIVTVAKNNGYTEPDPRDDLNGLDVARKVVILGRIAGMNLSLDTLPVENIVPEPLPKNNNQVLRYVGVIDPVCGESGVKLVSLPLSHPFATLKGSDNMIAFTTQRFPNPLIIQGAGAGAAVTAFGIFSDILKIADRFEP